MERYAVTQFGVDLNYNEYNNLIWEGLAKNDEDAINKCLNEKWDNEEDREWMRYFLKATKYQLN